MKAIVRQLAGAPVAVVIHRLNPIIRRWPIYYRGVVSNETFGKLDSYMWKLLWRCAVRRHRNKGGGWIAAQYWRSLLPGSRNRWIFGDQDTGARLHLFFETRIVGT
jgi:RNA-directed DNA polymerase